MSHPMDHNIDCPKCKTSDLTTSHYDDGPNETLFTPFWVCHNCNEWIDVEDLTRNEIDQLRNS